MLNHISRGRAVAMPQYNRTIVYMLVAPDPLFTPCRDDFGKLVQLWTPPKLDVW